MAGNKNDLYRFDEVTNEEEKELAKELNAIYRRISAKYGDGIDNLFEDIGIKFLHPENKINKLEEVQSKNKKLTTSKNINGKKKKKLLTYIYNELYNILN